MRKFPALTSRHAHDFNHVTEDFRSVPDSAEISFPKYQDREPYRLGSATTTTRRERVGYPAARTVPPKPYGACEILAILETRRALGALRQARARAPQAPRGRVEAA